MAEARKEALLAAFGADLAPQFEEILDETAKANYDAYKSKLSQLESTASKLSTLAAKVPKFWAKSLNNCVALNQTIDPVDSEPLQYITDVKIKHGEKDVRDFEVEFHFSPKNPYFSNPVLSKSLTVTPPASLSLPAPSPWDLDATLYLLPTPKDKAIKWTSDAHNLIKKAPRVKVDELEEYDDFNGLGSFFNWFEEEGKDELGIGETLLEWKGNALEYAAGLVVDLNEGLSDGGEDEFDEFDEDEEDEEDDGKSVDLESEDERPKKKNKKN
ncbi:hypothetical protein T439DRAFT_296828 [Meredithblackwellia eburnea MCA 4105]